MPSWCDRILWKSLPGNTLTQTSYEACDQIMTRYIQDHFIDSLLELRNILIFLLCSDHSPVRASFKVNILLPNHIESKQACHITITDLEGPNLPLLVNVQQNQLNPFYSTRLQLRINGQQWSFRSLCINSGSQYTQQKIQDCSLGKGMRPQFSSRVPTLFSLN